MRGEGCGKQPWVTQHKSGGLVLHGRPDDR